ncbi:MAG: hypothetical protein ACK56I_34995, partial [bacterium]
RGQRVDIWCGVALRAKAADIGVAHVIHENDDEVWLARLRGGASEGEEGKEAGDKTHDAAWNVSMPRQPSWNRCLV